MLTMPQLYTIAETKNKTNEHFGISSTEFTIRFDNLASEKHDSSTDQIQILYKCFEDLFKDLIGSFGENTLVRIVFIMESLDAPISLPFVRCNLLSVDMFFDAVENVLQSKQVIDLSSEDVTVYVVKIDMPSLGGKGRRNFRMDAWIKSSKSIVFTEREGYNLCMAKAICIGMAFLEGNMEKYKQYLNNTRCKGTRNQLFKDAVTLQQTVGVELG